MLRIDGFKHCVVCCAIFGALINYGPAADLLAQVNRTVGDNWGPDHCAFLFSPYGWAGDWGNDEYRYHVCSDPYGWYGQQYEEGDFLDDVDGPLPTHGECTLSEFYRIIHEEAQDLGVLLISSHGNTEYFSVECYEKSSEGFNNWTTAVEQYLLNYEEGIEIYYTEASTWFSIGVYGQFIRNYADFDGSLVFVSTCDGASLTDDFIAAGARVCIGHTDHPLSSELVPRVTTFFERLDGLEGREKRSVGAALQSPPSYLSYLQASGNLNTTLAPAVVNVDAPSLLKVGDYITINFDTECDQNWFPNILCFGCGDFDYEQFVSPTTMEAVYTSAPPLGTEQCEFTLKWSDVKSAWNEAYLDGNTDPWGGGNAEGPAHDDFV